MTTQKTNTARIEALENGMTQILTLLQSMQTNAQESRATSSKAANAKGKKQKVHDVEVVERSTFYTQELNKELKAVGMVSGKDYWAYTNDKKQTKIFACVHHTHPEWAKRLEALGFTSTSAFGGSNPAFAMYARKTDDLDVECLPFMKK